jgi:hypothetical protein
VAEPGIRACLRCMWEQSLGGSNPLIRTSDPLFWMISSVGYLPDTLDASHAGGERFVYSPRTKFGQLAQLVRASRLHREGRRSESYIAH